MSTNIGTSESVGDDASRLQTSQIMSTDIGAGDDVDTDTSQLQIDGQYIAVDHGSGAGVSDPALAHHISKDEQEPLETNPAPNEKAAMEDIDTSTEGKYTKDVSPNAQKKTNERLPMVREFDR